MPDQPDQAGQPAEVQPDPERVVRRLSEQLAQALAENAMLQDVVQQYVAREARAANTPPAEAP